MTAGLGPLEPIRLDEPSGSARILSIVPVIAMVSRKAARNALSFLRSASNACALP